MSKNLLEISGLKTHFFTPYGIIKAVDDISFWIKESEVIGLVGESGSGKTLTALSILRLVPDPGKIVGGRIIFEDEDILKKDEAEMRKIRGRKISMSFQDPQVFLNPVMRVGNQIAEAIQLHQGLKKSSALKEAEEMMELVGIHSASKRTADYPHQLSGGMQQRILIAIALACQPRLYIADEPTTALDVLVQAEILNLMEGLKQRLKSSILLITHNLGIVSSLCDRIVVMYAGRIMEIGDSKSIFLKPLHPYSEALINSTVWIDTERDKRLPVIQGELPDAAKPPKGCKFHPRCPYSNEKCVSEIPQIVEIRKGRHVACSRFS